MICSIKREVVFQRVEKVLQDFFDTLKYVFPEIPSVFVEELDDNELPDKYRGCPEFDF